MHAVALGGVLMVVGECRSETRCSMTGLTGNYYRTQQRSQTRAMGRDVCKREETRRFDLGEGGGLVRMSRRPR